MSLAHVRQGFGCVRPYVYGPHFALDPSKEASVASDATTTDGTKRGSYRISDKAIP